MKHSVEARGVAREEVVAVVPGVSTRAPLLLLHGALGSAAQLDPLARLLEPSFQLVVPDFSGHGPSAHDSTPFSMAGFVRDVLGALDGAGIERADVFGYSMGGYVALVAARDQRARIGRVFTLGTMLRWDPEIAAREAGKLDPELIVAKVPGFAALLERRHGDAWPGVVQRTAALMLGLGTAPALDLAELAALEQPVRIGVGDRDSVVSLDECRAALELLPQGELEVLPRTPHPFERANVERVAASVREFMAE